jgi:predicted metal-binding protein
MEYRVHCPVCGEYEVEERSFRAMLTPELSARLDDRIKKGGMEAVAFFNGHCPRCCKTGNQVIKLGIR